MVAAVRQGMKLREAGRRFGRSLRTVQYWIHRAGTLPLSAVDWTDRPPRPHRIPNRTRLAVEDRIVEVRRMLGMGELGFIGATAIRNFMIGQGDEVVPSIRTIGRILERRGVLDAQRRVRRVAPPPGWYLPDAAAALTEIDHFDVIEDLRIEDGPLIDVFTGCPLWSGHVMARPAEHIGARFVVEALLAHWKQVGLPTYAQYDNDTRFQGGHSRPDVLGRVIRCCLALGVTPVFAPPAEHGFQNISESFNGLWQRKVWHRFHHDSLAALSARSDRFTHQYALHRARRREQAPGRRPFPVTFDLDLQAVPRGQIIYLRRSAEAGIVSVLGRRWVVDPAWPHRLVRAHVDLNNNCIRFFRLRRKEPEDQPLIKEITYEMPKRHFLDS
jgi:hypothetical protein